MKAELVKTYTASEVASAIKDMAPLKASGSDGMPPLFYHTYWSDIGMHIS